MPKLPHLSQKQKQKQKHRASNCCTFPTNDDLKFKLMAQNLKKQLAKDTPFTENYQVSEAIGDFNAGDSVQGLTTKQILTKVLKLQTSGDLPPIEDVPVIESALIEVITSQEAPMYYVNEDGNLVELEYKQLILTEDEAITYPVTSSFYKTTNTKGEVIEAGYQYISINNPDGPFMIALPSVIDVNKDIRIETFNNLAAEGENPWVEYNKFNLTNNYLEIKNLCESLGWEIPVVDRENYYIWADLEQPASGAAFRFILL